MLIAETAAAKINLTLRVLGKRPDGYHQIESLVAFARLGDVLTLDTEQSPGVETRGPFAAAIDGPNLAEEALRRLAQEEPRLRLGLIELDKRLPVAAGIGGGSADAAAVLRVVRQANPARASVVAWTEIAAGLGADVPVCFEQAPAIMRGLGEIVVPVARLPRLEVVLVNPQVPVPPNKTARVFKYLDAPPLGPERRETEFEGAFSDRAALLDLMRRTGNDLFAPACEVMPDVVAVMSALEKLQGAELVQMSGAGPTCFAVFETAAGAAGAADALRGTHPHWWVEAAGIG